MAWKINFGVYILHPSVCLGAILYDSSEYEGSNLTCRNLSRHKKRAAPFVSIASVSGLSQSWNADTRSVLWSRSVLRKIMYIFIENPSIGFQISVC